MPTWPSVPESEDAIHQSMDRSKIIPLETIPAVEGTKDKPGTRGVLGRADWEKSTAWHPLADKWALALDPLEDPDPPTVSEQCMMDCKERERIRKKECAEIRKRVQAKLKELGCPSSVKNTDKTTVCGQRKSSEKKDVPKKKSKSGKGKGK